MGRRSRGQHGSLWIDALLVAQFAIPHSVLLLPAIRQRLTRIDPSAFYGCFYCMVTCASLLTMFAAWQPQSTVIWETSGTSDINSRRRSSARGRHFSTACI